MKDEYTCRPRDAAAEQIECYIISHGLQPHDRLPSERDMCAQWGFNRTTLRSAIRRLTMEGVVYNRVGSGTYVAPPKLVRNLQDVESFGSAVRRAGHALGTRVVRAALQEADKNVAQRLHVPLGAKVFVLARVRLLDSVPALLETTYVNAALCPGIETLDFYSGLSLYNVLEQRYGLQVKHGEETLNVTYLDDEEAVLLEMPAGSPALYQSGVVSAEDETPLEYFKSIALSQHIRFASVLTR